MAAGSPAEHRGIEIERGQQAMALLGPLERLGRTGEMPAAADTERLTACAAVVDDLDPAALYAVLTPPLCDKHPDAVLQWLHVTGVLARVLPELDATVDFSQEGDRRHKDVWDHTKTVVLQAVPRSTVRWAAVLHDIGKVTTRRFLPGGKVTFHGHAEEGVRMFRRGPARILEFPPGEHKRIELLIRHHLRPGQYEADWTDSAVRRFHREMEPFLRDLLDLSRADITSRRPGKRARCLRAISDLARRIECLAEEDARPKPLPAGLGTGLMHALGLPPGRHIGELRAELEALVEAGKVEGGQDCAYYLEQVRERGLLSTIQIRPPRGF